MRVDIECVDALVRTSAGKTPFVIHRAPVKKLLRAAVAARAERTNGTRTTGTRTTGKDHVFSR
jgi:hypothetical protein